MISSSDKTIDKLSGKMFPPLYHSAACKSRKLREFEKMDLIFKKFSKPIEKTRKV
jgi:hypothetical protein